jgi:hypothetical protein
MLHILRVICFVHLTTNPSNSPMLFDGPVITGWSTHMVAFQGDNATTLKTGNARGLFLSNEWMLAWEDLPWGAF